MQNRWKNVKNRLWNQIVFCNRFLIDFGANLVGFWSPSWSSKGGGPEAYFQVAPKRRPRGSQERPKRAPRASQERPRVPQERPRVPQERPRVPQERPKSVPRAPKTSPGPIFESSEVCSSWKDLNSNILEASPAPMFESSEVCSSREDLTSHPKIYSKGRVLQSRPILRCGVNPSTPPPFRPTHLFRRKFYITFDIEF